MATIKKFEDLVVWQESRKLCVEIFILINIKPFSMDYALVNQINRSSGSVMDNIAEGYGRSGNREFIQYLAIAKGSCNEVLSQLYRAKDRDYIEEDKFELMSFQTQSLINQLGGLIHYLNKSEFKGTKFKESKVLYQTPNPKP